jgi:hypothetical protein
MLIFYRASFKTGIMYIKVTVSGIDHSWTLRPTDNGHTINFGTEEITDAILSKYPSFFTLPA